MLRIALHAWVRLSVGSGRIGPDRIGSELVPSADQTSRQAAAQHRFPLACRYVGAPHVTHACIHPTRTFFCARTHSYHTHARTNVFTVIHICTHHALLIAHDFTNTHAHLYTYANMHPHSACRLPPPPPAHTSPFTRAIMYPQDWRVRGPLMNNQDFADTFHCPAGSPMNPAHKCELW